MQYTTEELNRSTLEKTVDEFYVEFLNVENNRANILARNVYSFERPSLVFNTFETHFKQAKMTNNTTIVFQPFIVTFRDDDLNLTNKILYEQLYRQAGVVNQTRSNKTFDKAKFDVRVNCYSSNKQPGETFLVKGCFITGITHSENIVVNPAPNRITVTMQCDTVNYDYIEAYVLGTDTSDLTGELP